MNKYDLDEVLDPQAKAGLVLTAVLSAIFWGCLFWEGRFEREDLLLLAAAMTLITFVPVAIFLVMLKARLRMDENGVTVCQPFRDDLALPWAEVRTAARVRLTKYDQLVLSPLEPQAALKRSRFIRRSGRRDGEIRLTYTEARRLAIEHYLGRKLMKKEL